MTMYPLSLKVIPVLFFLVTFFSQAAYSGQATLTWNPNSETDLAGYKIHFGTTPGTYTQTIDVALTPTPASPGHTIGNLNEGSTYYFSVTAYDSTLNESGFSNEVVKTIPVPASTTTPTSSTTSTSSTTTSTSNSTTSTSNSTTSTSSSTTSTSSSTTSTSSSTTSTSSSTTSTSSSTTSTSSSTTSTSSSSTSTTVPSTLPFSSSSTTSSTSSTTSTTRTTSTTSTSSTSSTTTSSFPTTTSTLPGGLRAVYFNNPDLTNPVLTRIDPQINFGPGTWGMNRPDPQINPDGFSVRWTGEVRVDFNEVYSFQAVANDGIRLWIDGELVLDYWNTGGVSTNGLVNLSKGFHAIKIEFYESTGEAWVELYWSAPSVPYGVVPQEHLFPPAATGTAPVLSWTSEDNFVSDGIEPHSGNTATPFHFRVRYTDAENDFPVPGFPRVHILKAKQEIPGSPFAMGFESSDSSGGLVYSFTTLLPTGNDFSFYFDAQDANGLQAVSAPDLPSPTAAYYSPTVGTPGIFGDLDGSGRVDGFDMGILGRTFGSRGGDPHWNPDADFNSNGTVDSNDLDILIQSFAKTNQGN